MASLYDILKLYVYPRTLKIVSGNFISEAGKQFGPGDRIVVYGGGVKVDINPDDITLLQSGKGRELFESHLKYDSFDVRGRIISSLFVPHNVGFQDAHYSQKTYTRVSELLLDRPTYVKVNTSFFALKENDEVRKMNERKILELLFDGKDVTSQKYGQTIKAKVDDEIILIHDSNNQLNVDSVFDEQVYDCNFVLNGRFSLPRIMSFSNKEIHQMFCLRTGYNRFVINKFKYAVCLSKCLDKQPEYLSCHMSVIRDVNCIDADITNLKKVRVEVLKNSSIGKLTLSFAHDTGIDPRGFKLFDVYLQIKQQTDVAIKPPPLPTTSPEDSDSSDLVYEEPVQRDTSEKLIYFEPVSDETYFTGNQTEEKSEQTSKTPSEKKAAVLPRYCTRITISHTGDLITTDLTNRINSNCGD